MHVTQHIFLFLDERMDVCFTTFFKTGSQRAHRKSLESRLYYSSGFCIFYCMVALFGFPCPLPSASDYPYRND